MLFPIVCNCGRPLGDYYDAYRLIYSILRDELINKSKYDVKPSMIMLPNTFNPSMGEVLDKLCIYTECCRKTMLAGTEFHDYF